MHVNRRSSQRVPGWPDGEGTTAARELRRAIGFRNVLVHGYTAVDPHVVRDVLEHRLDNRLTFVAAVRARR